MSFVLKLLGGLVLEGRNGPLTGQAAQRHRLALLALLEAARARTLSRDKLLGLLWPERDERNGRDLLNASVYVLRKALGEDAIITMGDSIRLSERAVESDLAAYEAALAANDLDAAVDRYGGPFLDGFYLSGSRTFEEWVDGERSRHARAYLGALEQLAERAEDRGNHSEAVIRWERVIALEPTGRATLGLMRALAAYGERSRALEVAQRHAERMRDVYRANPDPEVEALATRLRAQPHAAAREGSGPEADSGSRVASRSRIESRELPPEELAATTTRARPTVRRLAAVLAFGLGGIVVALAIGLGGGSLADSPPAPDRSSSGNGAILEPAASLQRIATVPLENATGDSALDPLGLMLSDWIAQNLAQIGRVNVVPVSTVVRVSPITPEERGGGPDHSGAAILTQETGATLLVLGRYYSQGDSIVVHVRLLDARTGEQVRTLPPVAGDPTSPVALAEEVGRRATAAIATAVDPDLSAWMRPASQPPSMEAYAEFTRAMQHFFGHRMVLAADAFGRSHALAPDFTVPLVWEVFARRNAGRFAEADSVLRILEARREQLPPWDLAMTRYHRAFHRRDWQAAHRAIEGVVEMAPGSEWLYLLGSTALWSNRPEAALAAYRRIDRSRGWIRRWPHLWSAMADAYHRLGRYQEELEIAREASRLFPDDWIGPNGEMRALIALGRPEAALSILEIALDRPFYQDLLSVVQEFKVRDDDEAARRFLDRVIQAFESGEALASPPPEKLGRLLYSAGMLNEAQTVFETRLAEAPEDADAFGHLGLIAARRGDDMTARRHAAALESYAERRAEWPPPTGSLPFTNGYALVLRGRISVRLGEPEKAVRFFRRAYDGGLPHDSWQRTSAEALMLRDYPPFQELMRPKG